MMQFRVWLALVATAALCGCGGGGGDDTGTRAPLPALSQDTHPSGERLDLRASNYFPAAAGDNWIYDRQPGGVPSGQSLTRSVTPAPGADVVISESFFGETESQTYRRSSDGIVAVQPLSGGVPAIVNQSVGDLLEYPEPFYPAGGTRSMIRQGDWGEDLDGDGTNESYRFEFTQVFVGLESVALPSGTLHNVARFHNVTTLLLQPSALAYSTVSITGTEEAWWAPDIGLVRAERSVVDQDGVIVDQPYTLVLTGGTVGGITLFAPAPDGTVVALSLVHNALVFDSRRSRYYASIPGSVTVNGNRIAIIEPATGAVSFSAAAVGSEPGALALSADGSALYVGLKGTGDVVKLSLPDMAEIWRTRLPNLAFYGQLFAERISVSPMDPDVVAVSMFRANLSPRHGGVALIRAGILQPTMTQDHTGSNLITFDGSGQFVYGFNNETTEFGLRRLAVLTDGLREEQVVASSSGNFGTGTLDWSANGLVLDSAVYGAPGLALLGVVNVDGGGCRPHAAIGRLVCADSSTFNSQTGATLAVVDPESFVILSKPAYSTTSNNIWLSEIVPGPAGQVALRMDALYFNSPASALWLFTSEALQ